jgi:hypothetical protein
MKPFYFLILLVLSGGFAGFAQKAAPVADVLELKETSFEFGSIPQGRPVTHNFVITNTGKKPLLIENVEAQCGCTTPQWDEKPIAPGATTIVKVGFNAASEGRFNKQIMIQYGGDKLKTLTITGSVYPMPATSAPPNPSLITLKQ